ncbi:MAG: hypothetical protein ACI8Q1_003264 [Parvicella sp.]|jgi:hypothetical protein
MTDKRYKLNKLPQGSGMSYLTNQIMNDEALNTKSKLKIIDVGPTSWTYLTFVKTPDI